MIRQPGRAHVLCDFRRGDGRIWAKSVKAFFNVQTRINFALGAFRLQVDFETVLPCPWGGWHDAFFLMDRFHMRDG